MHTPSRRRRCSSHTRLQSSSLDQAWPYSKKFFQTKVFQSNIVGCIGLPRGFLGKSALKLPFEPELFILSLRFIHLSAFNVWSVRFTSAVFLFEKFLVIALWNKSFHRKQYLRLVQTPHQTKCLLMKSANNLQSAD